VLGLLWLALENPNSAFGFSRIKQLLSTANPTNYRDQRIHELFQLFADFADPTTGDRPDAELSIARQRAAALTTAIARDDAENAELEHIDMASMPAPH